MIKICWPPVVKVAFKLVCVFVCFLKVQTSAWRSQTKIRRNFMFRPVLPGFGFVRPFFARFCPRFAPLFGQKMPVFLRVFACFCPVCQVHSVSPKFARVRSFSFVVGMRSLLPTGSDLNINDFQDKFAGYSIYRFPNLPA